MDLKVSQIIAVIIFLFIPSLRFGMNLVSGRLLQVHQRHTRQTTNTLEDARAFLKVYNSLAQSAFSDQIAALWKYHRNLTDENAQKNVEAQLKLAVFRKTFTSRVQAFDDVVDTFPDDVQRQMRFIRNIGEAALDNQTVNEFNRVMADIYSSARLCRPRNSSVCYFLDPGLQTIMASSTDWDERLWVWKGFRDAVGIPNKLLYTRYVDIANQGARANGYEDQGHLWRFEYGDDIEEKVTELYDAILPLYKQLHAYVRSRLHKVYGDRLDVTGYLPAHVLGDMWGRFWGNIYPVVVPYPDRPNIDVTDAMIRKGYNATWMFKMADEFFTSMGLLPVNEAFWENSMLTRPDDGRNVVCHPSAWDFQTGDDFRIAMCTEVTMDDLLVAHHEMGHIQYDMQYKDQPLPFKGGANGAFHEAIGEVMSLSVGTPKHLQEIELFDGIPDDDNETEINFLLKTSLDTIGTLPFSLGLARWRWDLMRGAYDVNNSMSRWWQIKNDLVGVEAPLERSNEDFDPGAMFHFVIDYPFIGYYIRTIIQFQFYKSLCEAANHTGPLHTCDFYRSTAAGQKLAEMLRIGRSRPWPDAMELLTGQKEMSADAILEYYQPLMEWLERTNRENGEQIGWPQRSACCQYTPTNLVWSLVAVYLTGVMWT